MAKLIYVDTSRKKSYKMNCDEFCRKLKPGDIILTGSWLMPLSLLIQYITKSRYSHAEIYMGSGVSVGAHFNGIKKSQVKNLASFHKRFIALRANDYISIGDRVAIYACSLCDRGYDFMHLFQYLWRIILGTLGKAPMNDIPDKYVCHEFAAVCWHKFNVKVGGKHADNATGRSFTSDQKLTNIF